MLGLCVPVARASLRLTANSAHHVRLPRAVDIDLHPVGIILKSQEVKGIRFTVSKEHWRSDPELWARLPETVWGEIV